MKHTVESHPQRKHIVDSLLKGLPLRSIAATLDPPLHFTSLQRYKKSIVRPALRRAVVVAKVTQQVDTNAKAMQRHGIHDVSGDVAGVALHEAAEAIQHAEITDPYLARIAQHQRTIDKAILETEDGKTIAALIGTDLKGIDLDARLTGRLDHDKPSQNISLAVMVSLPRAIPNVPRPVPAIDVSLSRPAIDRSE